MPTSQPVAPAPDLSALPIGFVWGAATSSFQIEGDADGRGDSIWDAMCREPGRIRDGSHARVACDHVHRYREDVGLLKDLGVDAYRFSISWPRVQPGGTGPMNPKGLDFYDRLVDELLSVGIDPWVTLYHWDLPTELEQAGGWPVRETVARYVDYAVGVHTALGDRVRHWATFNEPWCAAWLGYGIGIHAPGLADIRLASRTAHHLLLAHGAAVQVLREQAPADHQFGIVLNPGAFRAAPELSERSADAVRPATRALDGLQTRWWLDALLLGTYPADTYGILSPHLGGVVLDGDLETIAQPLDYLGVNYYSDQLLAPAGGLPGMPWPGAETVTAADPGPDATTMGWPVTPDGLRALLVRIATEYPAVPLVITENGAAYADGDVPPGRDPVPDPMRVAYLHRHLSAVADAVAQGVDVRGYFAWSLMDNFEWAEGYQQRFGLVRVDFDTLERRVRESFVAYRDAITAQRGGVTLEPE